MSKISPDGPDSIDDYEQDYLMQEDDKSIQLFIPDSKLKIDKKRLLYQIEKMERDSGDQ